MNLDGVAGVQSRIAAIQEKIAVLSNQGRPPVAVTELRGKNPVSAGAAGVASVAARSTSPFVSEYAEQITSTEVGKSSLLHGRDVIQGQPGTVGAFVQHVRSYIGVPYVWGGTNPTKGLDRSGLVQTAARKVGVKLPCMTYDQQYVGEEADGIENARPGDLIICHKSGHVAVHIGDNRVTHAPRLGGNVTEASVKDMGPIDTIRRVMRSENDSVLTVTTGPAAVATRRLASTATLAPPEVNVEFSSSGDLASTLISQLSGQNRALDAYGGTRQGGIGTISANAALLNQPVGTGTVVNPALNPLVGAAPDAMSPSGSTASTAALNTTARPLGATSALHPTSGV